MTNDLIATSSIINSKVVTPGHKDIGTIEDIVIHKESNRIAYVILKSSGFLGFGEKRFPIPFGAFYTDTNEPNKIILNIDKERLEQAPAMDVDDYTDFDFSEFLWKVYHYYGVKPYLTNFQGESDISLSKDPITGPSTIREARLKNSKFDNNHSSAHDRHTTHLGL